MEYLIGTRGTRLILTWGGSIMGVRSSPCATLNTCKTKEQNLIAIILHIRERGCANGVLKTYFGSMAMVCYFDRALADEGEGCLSFG